MAQLVPNRFLFKFEFPLSRCPAPPAIDGKADAWTPYRLPSLARLDGRSDFGDVFATWDDDGIYIACQVAGKHRAPKCDPDRFWKSDNLRLMLDMRDTRTIRRATRFCQQFYFMPAGAGKGDREPIAAGAKIHRATEDAPVVPPGEIAIASNVTRAGYTLTAHVPARCLMGFDPQEHRRIGFYYMLEDDELGQQPLTVGDELNWWIDPSTWPTAILTDAG